MSDVKDFHAKLKALGDGYATQLPEKLEQIQNAWEKLPDSTWDDENFRKFYHLIHSLTGSGKTFGFKMISDVSLVLEEFLKPLKVAKQPLNPEQSARIRDLIGELHQVASYRDNSAVSQDALIAITRLAEPVHPLRRIFVVEDNHEFADELRIHLSYFGYEVSVFYKLKDFLAAMKSQPNVVVLMDVNFPGDDMGGIKSMREIQRGRESPVPVLFVSAYNEFKVRLEAARAGGIAYLKKPPNIGNLIDKLDELTSSSVASPYRVMVVDDSAVLTEYYSTVLEQA
ncbi:MAG: response regulator, partial [Gallionella sp.]|nr:response regulator [Gallionella sp.]